MLRELAARFAKHVGRTPLGLWPVRVRGGLAQGARWTLLPSSAYWRGTFEHDVDAAVRRIGLSEGMCCWDLGTHFGIYTVGMALAVGPTGQVVGFEPDPISYRRCRRHVNMNGITWARLYDGAASDRTGEAEVLIYSGFGQSTTHLAYSGETGNGAIRHKIGTYAADDLVERGEIRPAHFIKIDVEGHAAKALHGMRRTLDSAKPHVVISIHCDEEAVAVRHYFPGYRCRDCSTGMDVPFPTDSWTGVLHLDPQVVNR